MNRGEIRAEIQKSIARSDSDVQTFINRGLNAGQKVITFMYEPPELRTKQSLTALSTANFITAATLTRFVRIDHVWNSTGSNNVWPIPFKNLDVFWLPTSGNVEYYSMYGNVIHYRPQPSTNETLDVYTFGYPANLDDDADEYPFTIGLELCMGIATEYTWACMEENENVDIWNRLSEKYSLPQEIVAQVRRSEREEIDVSNLQGAVV